MGCDPFKERRIVLWYSPPFGVLEFNVDGASRGKPGLAGIGGVLRNCKGKVLIMFSKYVDVCDPDEADVLAIFEGLRLFLSRYGDTLIMESDSSNAIAWVSK